MKVNEVLTLAIADLALGGKALARHEGKIVFLDRGLPGDLVRARLIRIRRQYADARLESIDVPSADRVAAPCPHVQRCGGCRFQDLDYAVQCRIKERQGRETLIHLAGLPDPPVGPIVPAPEPVADPEQMGFSFHPGEKGEPGLGRPERGAGPRVPQARRV